MGAGQDSAGGNKMAKQKKARTAKRRAPNSAADSGAERAKPAAAALQRSIERLDAQIVELCNQRAQLARDMGQQKQRTGADVYAPEREQSVVDRAVQFSGGPLDARCIRAVFRELVSGARALAYPLRVAYLGPQFTYSHLAAIHRFGQSAHLVPVATIAAVFEEVTQGQSRFGVVPIENSTDGRVSDTLEMFADTSARICGEVPLHIHHQLLCVGHRQQITKVYSKPQAISQCRNWLARHLPDARSVEVASTADAARRAKLTPNNAAIASRQAAVNYGLPLLAENIEDNPGNLTRFAVIGTAAADRTGSDKTSLMFEISHRTGALADVTAIFKRNRLNMTWIESFPIRGAMGRYLFFVEFVGHQQDLRARRALQAIGKKTVRLEVLGSYARRDPIG